MYQTLLTTLENGIYTITINRPDKLNALNKDVFTDLDNAVNEINSNPEIKSAVIQFLAISKDCFAFVKIFVSKLITNDYSLNYLRLVFFESFEFSY